MPTINTDNPADTLKMIRETLCLAQASINYVLQNNDQTEKHIARIGRLIADIDQQRPLGSNGKHGNKHTKTCGCEDV